MLFRKLYLEDIPRLFPLHCMHFAGYGEESMLVYNYYRKGFYTLKSNYTPTLHRHQRFTDTSHDRWGDTSPTVEYLSKMLGAKFELSLGFMPSENFWQEYVKAAIERFGSCEGLQIRSQYVE
jgi:hypothetical protein